MNTSFRSMPAQRPAWHNLLALAQGQRAAVCFHLVGIGGAGLSAIARVLLGKGYQVSGSDVRRSNALAELEALGAVVFIGQRAEQVAGADLVLFSSAIQPDNPEVHAAQAAGIPAVKREQFLAPLMAGHTSICVAGTHGKTTTSAMIASLLDAMGKEPSFIVGSDILALGTNARNGRENGPFVLEADEYDHMFLGLQPDIAVITNVEWDHVDCYPNPAEYRRAFANFAALVSPAGTIIYCGDDPGASQLRAEAPPTDQHWQSYGVGANNYWRAVDIHTSSGGGTDFLVERGGVSLGSANLSVPGSHNVLNALAALAAVEATGCVFTDGDKNLKILRDFAGTARRLEHKGESYGIIVLDDYAHHPTEVRATLSAARQRYPRRAIWVLFQPHTYSRTHALLSEFCESLKNADHVLITDIYAAREHDPMNISAQELIVRLDNHQDARYVGDLAAASVLLLAELQPGDVLITMGAGDSNTVGNEVLAKLRARVHQSGGQTRQQIYAQLTEAIEKQTGLTVLTDEPLAAHTTMKVGGPADLFVKASSLTQLSTLISLARQHSVNCWLLGGGSNVVVSDAGIRGLVVANACRAARRHEGQVVWAESGTNLAGLARQTLQWGLSGLEWGVSVPGTVGGAVVGNAGAHGGCVADNLLRATLLFPDGTIAEWPATRFHFAYRYSALKEQLRSGQTAPIVLAAAFQLAEANPAEIETRAASFLAHRRSTQPVEPSAGSIFQNPPGDYAGRILEMLGFKGHSHGGAMFSTVHANFIVNRGGALASDVVNLIDQARQMAWKTRRIELIPEVLFVGDWAQMPPYLPLSDLDPGVEAIS